MAYPSAAKKTTYTDALRNLSSEAKESILVRVLTLVLAELAFQRRAGVLLLISILVCRLIVREGGANADTG